MNPLEPLRYHYLSDDIEHKKQEDACVAKVKWVLKNNCAQDLKIFNIGSFQLNNWYNIVIEQVSFEKIYLWRHVSEEIMPSEIIFYIFNLTKNLGFPPYDKFYCSLSVELRKHIVECDYGLSIAEAIYDLK